MEGDLQTYGYQEKTGRHPCDEGPKAYIDRCCDSLSRKTGKGTDQSIAGDPSQAKQQNVGAARFRCSA